MRAQVRRIGNSSGIVLPKPLLDRLGVAIGDTLDFTVEDGRLVLAPVPAHPRAGWAEAAAQIAETGDDGLVWPAFAHEGDADLQW